MNMSKYMVDDFDLTHVADKVRESSGISENLVFPHGFANNIKVCYEERPSVFEFNITSELTQTLHFTQSEPNAVLIDWGDGSPVESFIGTKSSFGSPEYYVNDAAHTFRFPGKYLVSFNVKKNRTWMPGTGSLGVSFLGYNFVEKSPSNPALTSVNIGDGISDILGNIQFYGATGLEYAHFRQRNAKGNVFANAVLSSTIKNVIFGYNIQSIGDNVFKDNTSLERLELGLQINSLSKGAFAGCTGLKEVYIKSAAPPRNYYSTTFQNVSTEIPFYVQRDQLENYKSIAFYNKFNLQPYDF